MTDDTVFRSAEEWLAARGIERRPIRVDPDRAEADGPPGPGGERPTGPPPSTRELAQLATEAPPVVPGEGVDPSAPGSRQRDPSPSSTSEPPDDLGDEVARALAFIRRSTTSTPASSARLGRKLRSRDVPDPAIRLALADATEQGLVDDPALAAALVAEGRAKGYAPRRLRIDLRKRELPEHVIDAALGAVGDRDPEAVAFDVAARKAREYTGLDAETAFRRLVGYLARRGHGEAVSRKVARQVVFDAREPDRIAGH